MTRQRRWQIKKAQKGLCITCGRKRAAEWGKCLEHHLKERERQTRYQRTDTSKEYQRKWLKSHPDYKKEWSNNHPNYFRDWQRRRKEDERNK